MQSLSVNGPNLKNIEDICFFRKFKFLSLSATIVNFISSKEDFAEQCPM